MAESMPCGRGLRKLREQDRVIYYPKPQLYHITEGKSGDSFRRSTSAEPVRQQRHQQPRRRSASVEPRLMAGRRAIRSMSVDAATAQMPGRRAIRSTSVEGANVQMPGRRGKRSQSIDYVDGGRGRNSGGKYVPRRANNRTDISVSDINATTIRHLAHSQSILTEELIKVKGDLSVMQKKKDLLTKQDSANQKLIAELVQSVGQKDRQISGLKTQLQMALNHIGNSFYAI